MDPLTKLIVSYKNEGFTGKEATTKAETELARRRNHELQMKDTATGKLIALYEITYHNMLPEVLLLLLLFKSYDIYSLVSHSCDCC